MCVCVCVCTQSGAALDATFSARRHGTGSGGSNALPTLTPAALNTPGGNSQQATPRVTQRTNSGTKVPSRPPSGGCVTHSHTHSHTHTHTHTVLSGGFVTACLCVNFGSCMDVSVRMCLCCVCVCVCVCVCMCVCCREWRTHPSCPPPHLRHPHHRPHRPRYHHRPRTPCTPRSHHSASVRLAGIAETAKRHGSETERADRPAGVTER